MDAERGPGMAGAGADQLCLLAGRGGVRGLDSISFLHALRRGNCGSRRQAATADRDAVGNDGAGLCAGRAGVVQSDNSVGGGGDRVPEWHGHVNECAKLPGAGSAAGEARRPDQRHCAEFGAVQYVAHCRAHAGRIRDGHAGRGRELFFERREFSGGAVGAHAHPLSGPETGSPSRACGPACGADLPTCAAIRRC